MVNFRVILDRLRCVKFAILKMVEIEFNGGTCHFTSDNVKRSMSVIL